MDRVIFGISGSIAAFKGLDVIRLLVKDGISVLPVLSGGGSEFVTRLSVESLAGRRAITEIFPDVPQNEFEHIVLSREADLLVTCPASADILAKYACGIADDPLALVSLTFGLPHIVVPAMNPRLWSNPATQANVKLLVERGFEFIGPVKGGVACGDEGWGRMSPVEEIYGKIKAALGRKGPLAGKRIVITAGATREPIDDVRYISNRSSGKMGFALASIARDMGAQTTLITATKWVPLAQVSGVNLIKVETTGEMFNAVVEQSANADVIIMSAAPADFTPVKPVKGKIKKDSGLDSIKLKPTTDILTELGKRDPKPYLLVGFAAEYGPEGRDEAKRKCREKNCDFVCLNDISRTDIGFSSDENEITIVYPDGSEKSIERCAKMKVAKAILDEIVSRL
ncbi:MAG: bifunctional phosphopantothenoylcysteine decarboxylase/phosphopantothenate--cysteine ligase CoaBC [bacterium]